MEETNLKDENNKCLLEQLYNISKQLYALVNTVQEKTCNESFKSQLQKNKQDFCEFKAECETLAKTLGISLQEMNWFKKFKNSASLNFNILFEDGTEALAKHIIVIFNRNIIDLITAVDNCPNSIEEVKNVELELRKYLEKNLENYKKYLVKNPSAFNKKTITKKSEQTDKLKKKTTGKSKAKKVEKK